MSLAEFLSGMNLWLGLRVPMGVYALLAAMGVLFLFVMPVAGMCTYVERKISADIQERIGPNRVGPLGLLQFLADGVKMFLKEDTRPAGADAWIFNLAPCLVTAGALGAFAVVPFARVVVGANLDIGVFFALAVSTLVSLGILLGAWSSNNKWSLLGGMRGVAQIVSFEIPLGLCLLSVVTASGSLNMIQIVDAQAWPGKSGGAFWNVFHDPFLFLNFFVYFISALAECNRTPFDLPEAESELVSGYVTEFSGMRYGLFALAEFAEVVLFACIASAVFLGGWHLPFVNLSEWNPSVQLGSWQLGGVLLAALMAAIFLVKVALLVLVVMWVRWSLPRLRVDQLMSLCWKYLVPISFFNLFGVALWTWLARGQSLVQLLGAAMGLGN